jgi:hypothetical protein
MTKASGRVLQMRFPDEVVDYDQDAFDNLVRNVGVPLTHYKAIRSPVGMVDRADLRKPNPDNTNTNSGGFIYKKAGDVTVLFTNVNNSNRIMELGEMDGSTVQVTLPRFYDSNPDEAVKVVRYDRLYLTDPKITVTDWQLFTTHETGHDRLTYPVESVEYIVDSYGQEYSHNSDFSLLNGQIVWGPNRPPPNTVCSIRYQYRPYWYVSRLVHEVRVTNREDMMGNRETIRMPIMVMLQREFLFESDPNNPANPDNSRQTKAPTEGSFGPR